MDVSLKECPGCNKEFNQDVVYCPNDGSQLQYKPLKKVCFLCAKQYGEEYKFCPIHGEELLIDIELLDEKSTESFRKYTCPKCGAWKNWEVDENKYTCKSCNETFYLWDDKVFSKPGKSEYEEKKEFEETLPYYPLLSSIDKSNCDHWLDKFQKFDENISFRTWNWPSFFLGIARYFWKGMWKKGLIIWAIIWVIALIDGFIGTGRILYILGALGIRIYLGFAGSIDYYKFINKFEGNIKKAKSSQTIGRVLLVILIILNYALIIFSRIQPNRPPV